MKIMFEYNKKEYSIDSPTEETFLVLRLNKDKWEIKHNEMVCLCCGESHPLLTVKLTTSLALMKAFEKAHREIGCSQEKYDRQRLLEEL